ncbi:MAG: pyridoxal-phosphate dependent enzyme [Candidatus Obscuribacterales bacterium]|nr:pyridoxal-phosphate dependent enzyme [Candidatus Obscuribacterales bacterium]
MPSLNLSPDHLAAVRKAVRPTTIIRCPRLDEVVGSETLIASETFQYTGSFKFRAAYSAALRSPASRLIAASSGNFGQALAYAASLMKKEAIIVMPDNSASVKVEAVKRYGGRVELVETKKVSRAQRVSQLAEQYPDAQVLSAYDHDDVIAGNSTLGAELAELCPAYDTVIVPVGGGGLSAGLIAGLNQAGSSMEVYGAEPLLANDAKRSLEAGRIIVNEEEPQTIADGARTVSLGERNWSILHKAIRGILEVKEEEIENAVRLLFNLANLKAEPTGGLALGAAIANRRLFQGKRVICVVSGGNVNPDVFIRILEGA